MSGRRRLGAVLVAWRTLGSHRPKMPGAAALFSTSRRADALRLALVWAGCATVVVAGLLGGTAPDRAVVASEVRPRSCAALDLAVERVMAGPADELGGRRLDAVLQYQGRLVHGDCREERGAAGTSRALAAWLERPAATVHPVEVSPACRRRTGRAADEVVSLVRRRAPAPEVLGAVDRLVQLLGQDCTVGDQLALRLAVVEPARAPGTSGAAPFAAEVRVPATRARLSEVCAQALRPVRARLAEAVGSSMSTRSIDELQRGVAQAAPSCSTREIADFERDEVAAALGLVPVAPGG